MKFSLYLFVALSFLLFYVTSAQRDGKNPCYRSCTKEKNFEYMTAISDCKTNSTSNIETKSCKLIAKGQFLMDKGACLVGDCATSAQTSAPTSAPTVRPDWYLGNVGENCNTVCSTNGPSGCRMGPMSAIRSSERVRYVLTSIGVAGGFTTTSSSFEAAPWLEGATAFYQDASAIPSQCDSRLSQTRPQAQRICCCGPNCPYE
jgi:hypothetical protein